MRRAFKWALLAGFVATGATACTPEDEADPQEVQQAVMTSVDGAAQAIVDGLELLVSSQMAEDFLFPENCFQETFGYWDEDLEEWIEEEVGEPQCFTDEPDMEAFDEGRHYLMAMLEARIFTAANVESTDDGVVTYLLRGDVVCEADDFFDDQGYQSCVDDFDDLQVRLAAEFDDDLLHLDVQVGPVRHHLVSLVFGSQEVSAQVDLQDFEAALEFLAELAGDEMPAFPELFEGRLQLGYEADGDLHQVALAIIDDLKIGHEDFELHLEGVGQVWSMGLDAAAETLQGALSLGQVYLRYPMVNDPDGDSEPVEPPMPGDDEGLPAGDEAQAQESVEVEFESAGLSASVTFESDDESLQWNNIGLGGGPTTFSVEGEEVLRVGLSAAMSNAFDAFMHLQEEGLEAILEPGFQLEIETRFHRVEDIYDDYEEWMLDEVLTIVVDGQAPTLLFADEALEVLSGALSLLSESTDHGAVVEAGMCLIDGEDAGDLGEDEPFHPFQGLQASQCQQ